MPLDLVEDWVAAATGRFASVFVQTAAPAAKLRNGGWECAPTLALHGMAALHGAATPRVLWRVRAHGMVMHRVRVALMLDSCPAGAATGGCFTYYEAAWPSMMDFQYSVHGLCALAFVPSCVSRGACLARSSRPRLCVCPVYSSMLRVFGSFVRVGKR